MSCIKKKDNERILAIRRGYRRKRKKRAMQSRKVQFRNKQKWIKKFTRLRMMMLPKGKQA